jgi:protocatechuate 3,4-dioxygenase beta subunit
MTRFHKNALLSVTCRGGVFHHNHYRVLPKMITPSNGEQTKTMHKERPMTLRNVTRNLAVGMAAGIALIAVQSARAADDRGSVQGVVNDASGKPVTGAMVKLKNADRRLTFMVPSQEAGRF